MALGSPQWMYKSGEAYTVDQSLKLDDAKGSFLSRTPSSGGNRRTYTISTWIKRGNIQNASIVVSGADNNYVFRFRFNGGALHAYDYHGGSNQFQWVLQSNAQFRDTSAWYHVLLAVDTTQATNTNRIKMYVNGSQITDLGIASYPSQNYQSYINDVEKIWIGETISEDSALDSYLAELHFIDGQQLTPADFGETGDYGEWKPVEYSGTYGTNGFYLPFKNDYTVEGFSAITYKGNSTNRYLGGFGFKPGFIWQKTRDYGYGHQIVDAVRGSENEFYEVSNATSGDEDSNANGLTGFKTDGVTLGTGNGWNNSSRTQVMWAWDMGADTPTGFGCVTYKGNGANRDIENVGFKPDLVWIRERATTSNNYLIDSVRGANNVLYSDITNAEQDASGPGTTVTKFNPDGFGLGTSGGVNQSGNTNVAWCWDMGNTTVTNTSGTISSQVRANPTYGQSIVKWTGNGTTGHGLSSAPEMIIVKPINATGAWWVWHKDLSNTSQGFLQLNTTAAEATNSSLWDNASPVSATTINANTAYINYATDNYIAYCFHSVTGYSKIGSYTGNGSTTGPTVTLGFRPAFIMLKSSTQAENWNIIDNVRSPFDKYSNGSNLRNVLKANSSVAESQFGIKFTDTGFQPVTTDGECNANGQTYIYMAFAGGLDSIADHNTTGTIPSYVKANPTYGQSVVSYIGNNTAGATVGHGLSSAPEMILIKNRDLNSDWIMYHTALGNTKHLRMNLNNSAFTSALRWNNTTPSSSVFTLGSDSSVSENNDRCIAYCFHSVTGYSKFGSYTGNGSNTGPVVTTGFRPAFLLLKNTEAAGSWYIYDNVRDPADKKGQALWANNSNANTTFYERLKFTDSGFQLLHTDTDMNGNGTTYVYIAFADKREYAYWLDQSGNNNDFTSNNLTESDISVDSPTNNFATMNPLGSPAQSSVITYSEGNLKTAHSGTNLNSSSVATMQLPPSGKYYWEVLVTAGGDNYVGVGHNWVEKQNNNDWIFAQGGWSYRYNGQKYSDGTANSYGDAFVANDLIGCAVDVDNSKIYFSKNGVWQNSSNPATSTNPAYTNVTGDNLTIHTAEGSSAAAGFIANFGQDSSFAGNKTAQGYQDGNDIGDFYYTPPTGFLALCTKNLPDVAVTPSEHFNTVLYNGSSSTPLAVTGVGFSPDMTWLKARSTGWGNGLFTRLNGTGAGSGYKYIFTNTTAGETDQWGAITFDSDGFTGVSSGYNGSFAHDFGGNGQTFVSWNWKANGSGSANTNGSINSTVSANVDAGFSIVSYNGTEANATVGHGLSKAPEMILTKNRGAATNWGVYNFRMGTNKVIYLDSTSTADTDTAVWQNTTPTSSVFSIGNTTYANADYDYIAYCFHSVDGYSKVGSYTGNGSTDGTFVYTSFAPAFILWKNITDANTNWIIFDNKRDTYNPNDDALYPNTAAGEEEDYDVDFLSNGFKFRNTSSWANLGGKTYIYLAFAETPFKYSNAK